MWFGLDFANKIRTQDVGETEEGVTQGSRISEPSLTFPPEPSGGLVLLLFSGCNLNQHNEFGESLFH